MKSMPRNILLAEDNDDDAFLTQRALESAAISYPIHRCRDGQALIDYLEGMLTSGQEENRLPGLILLDLKMPRLSGLEALKWIRQHEIFHSLIVVALTSSNERRDVETAYRLHINAYLVKPSSLSEMIEVARAIRHFWLDQNYLVAPRLELLSK